MTRSMGLESRSFPMKIGNAISIHSSSGGLRHVHRAECPRVRLGGRRRLSLRLSGGLYSSHRAHRAFPTCTRCCTDCFQVYGGPDLTSPRLTQLCSRRRENVTVSSNGHQMLVRFRSDGSIGGRGFLANFRTKTQGRPGFVSLVPSMPHFQFSTLSTLPRPRPYWIRIGYIYYFRFENEVG